MIFEINTNTYTSKITGNPKCIMRAEISAYIIYLEELEYPEYVMNIFCRKYSGTPKYGKMLGNFLPIGSAQQTTENYLKIFGVYTIKECVMAYLFA